MVPEGDPPKNTLKIDCKTNEFGWNFGRVWILARTPKLKKNGGRSALYFIPVGFGKSGRVQEQKAVAPNFKTTKLAGVPPCILYFGGSRNSTTLICIKISRIWLSSQLPLRKNTQPKSNLLLKWPTKSIGTVAVRRLRLLDTYLTVCMRVPSLLTLYSSVVSAWSSCNKDPLPTSHRFD